MDASQGVNKNDWWTMYRGLSSSNSSRLMVTLMKAIVSECSAEQNDVVMTEEVEDDEATSVDGAAHEKEIFIIR